MSGIVGKGAWYGVSDYTQPIAPCPPRHRWRAGRDRPGTVHKVVPCAFAHPTDVALALIFACALASTASAQQPLPRIWDVQLPSPVGDLPEEEFVDPACGTNGGPPGLSIGTFERFEQCRAEASGLREIWFRYDDE